MCSTNAFFLPGDKPQIYITANRTVLWAFGFTSSKTYSLLRGIERTLLQFIFKASSASRPRSMTTRNKKNDFFLLLVGFGKLCEKAKFRKKMPSPRIEPGFHRPQRCVLTTILRWLISLWTLTFSIFVLRCSINASLTIDILEWVVIVRMKL